MKILLVNHFPLDGSGSGTYTKNTAVYLAKCGHEVRIILPENRLIETTFKGVRLHPVYFSGGDAIADCLPFSFPCFTTHPRSNMTFGMLSESELEAYIDAFDMALNTVISEFEPDIIHAQHVWLLSYLAARTGIPSVITAHGTGIMGCDKWPEFKRYADRAIELCDRVITISYDNQSLLLDLYPQASKKTTMLRNGYSEEVFYPEKQDRADVLSQYGIRYGGERLVLFAGKLTGFKGADTLLYAAKKYEALSLGRIMTVIAGDGECGDALRAQSKELGLCNTFFIGNRTQEELRRLYNAAEVFAMPSRREPFGLVALEAMACGTPVVCTNEGGLPDFVNEQVGTLINANDPDALSAAVLGELARQREHPERKGLIASYARENFSQSKLTGAVVDVYRSILFEHKGGCAAS